MRSLLASLSISLVLLACTDAPGGAPSPGSGGSGGSTTSSSTSTSSAATTGAGGEVNGAPTADAGPDQLVKPGAEVVLDGNGSSDPEGFPVTFAWTQLSTGAPFVELSSDAHGHASFIAPAGAGQLLFRLVVTDYDDATGSDELTVQVKSPPSVDAGADLEGLAGETRALAATVSEPDGDATTVLWTQIAGPPVALSDPASLTPTFTFPAGFTGELAFELVATDSEGASVPDWVTAMEISGPDSDGDLLDDEGELAMGCDPLDPDSDADGLPDGWEALGHDGLDYAALGCDPRHRDLLVEVDYQEKVVDGVMQSARPGAALLGALTAYYAALPIPNPDGSSGIAYHPVLDSVLPPDETGPTGMSQVINPPSDNPRYREGFHVLMFWLGVSGGVAEVHGRHLNVSSPPADADPDNDLEEEAVFDAYIIALHEMGHNLGLQHGGEDNVNWKPNYPSYMNYEFGFTIDGSPKTIAGTALRLSAGLLPSIDECALVEQGAFAGVPAEQIAYLAKMDKPWSVSGDGSVDWNGNGTLDASPYEQIVRSSTFEWAAQPFPGCQLLKDSDDVATITAHLADGLPANPKKQPQPLEIGVPRWVP